jgi:hypothetical protein
MQRIPFAGLPGTGKSSVAEAVGRQPGIPVFAKDWIEATLRRCGRDKMRKARDLQAMSAMRC